jgi:hypothetical protein
VGLTVVSPIISFMHAAAPFCSYLAFQCLCNLIQRDHVFVFFHMDRSILRRFYLIYERLLEQRLPELKDRLDSHGIVHEMYLFPWFQVGLRSAVSCF